MTRTWRKYNSETRYWFAHPFAQMGFRHNSRNRKLKKQERRKKKKTEKKKFFKFDLLLNVLL